MTKPSVSHLLASSLLDLDNELRAGEGLKFDATARIFEKLRLPLSQLAGPVGYSSLISRTLVLTRKKYPFLKSLDVGAQGKLEFMCDQGEFEDFQKRFEDQETGVELVAQLMNLLITFIGESLTVSLLKDAWPNGSFEKVAQRIGVES